MNAAGSGGGPLTGQPGIRLLSTISAQSCDVETPDCSGKSGHIVELLARWRLTLSKE